MKLVDFQLFNLHLLKRCVQKSSSAVFGSPDAFSLSEFLVTRLKGAEDRD